MSEKKQPDVRFKGFHEEWEKLALDNIFNIIDGDRGENYPGNTDFFDMGCTLFLDTGNVRKSGFNFSTKKFISHEKDQALRNGKLEMHDFVMTSRGTLGNIAFYDEKIHLQYPSVRINSAMLILRPLLKEKISNVYMESILRGNVISEFMTTNHVGSAQPHITKKDFSKLCISVPVDILEQGEIGEFFKQLDSLISLNQSKYDKLINMKKACLEKMFPKDGADTPEIRFKGCSGKWQEYKLCDLAEFVNGRAYKQEELLDKGTYKVLRVGNFYTNGAWYYSNLELDDKYYAKNGDLLYTWSATFGPHIWYGDKVIFHYHIWKINLSDMLDKNFAIHLLNNDRDKITSDKNGSTMVHITKSGMENKIISIPTVEEQKEIARLLDNLDNLITLENIELDKLKNIKKALLEKMFI